MRERTAAQGRHFTLVWAQTKNGRHPGLDFYETLSPAEKAQMNALFKRLARKGRIQSQENFKRLGKRAKGPARKLWEFKKFQLRFLGGYRSGKRFVIATGHRKKRNQLSSSEIERAVRILHEHDLVAETSS